MLTLKSILNKSLLLARNFRCHQSLSSSLLSTQNSYYITKLQCKNLIAINGQNSIDFLQGLLTNNIEQLSLNFNDNSNENETKLSLYSFLLNSSGRIIADLFLYQMTKTENDSTMIFIEIDKDLSAIVMKLFKRYKIRSKISIKLSDDDWNCYQIFPCIAEHQKSSIVQLNDFESDTIITNDPRHKNFGYKLISKIQSIDELIRRLKYCLNPLMNDFKFTEVDENRYRLFRYQYGIGEGLIDLPIESSLPFDANGDILNAISFQKGCYIGQELTARTYHTGVIRKRLMPIKILSTIANDENNQPQQLPIQNVIDMNGKNLGRFRSNLGEQGLALLKFDSIISNDMKLKLSNTGHFIRAWRPFWWPDSIVEQQMKLS